MFRGRKFLSLLLTFLMFFSLLPTAPLSAFDEAFCIHDHEAECWRADAGHTCSEDEGCVPVYPAKTEAHFHDEIDCFDEEGDLTCELEEGEPVILDEADMDADPDYWICGAQTLSCEHEACVYGETCLAWEDFDSGDEGMSLMMAGEFSAFGSVTISNEMSDEEARASIQSAIDAASGGDSVYVEGLKTNGKSQIELSIPSGVTVAWAAETAGLALKIKGPGDFDLTVGGKISIADGKAIELTDANVTVSGGSVYASGDGPTAITVNNGNVIVTDGIVYSSGLYSEAIVVNGGNVTVSGGDITAKDTVGYGCDAIILNAPGAVTVTGGSVKAIIKAFDNYAISLWGGGLAAYLAGTCEGLFKIDPFNPGTPGIIVEVDSLSIPSSYGGTNQGMTRKAGNPITTVKWDVSGVIPVINFSNGARTLEWKAPAALPAPPPYTPVRIKDSATAFETLGQALTYVASEGLNEVTLEVVGDVTETSSLQITSDVTIIGAEGDHVVSMASSSPSLKFTVESGGSLTLGETGATDTLTILRGIEILNGYIEVYDGIYIKDGRYALHFDSPNAGGRVYGGRFEGDWGGANIQKGAQVYLISGGVFSGRQEGIHMTDTGTLIHEISGGNFYQTVADISLHGQALFLQNNSRIGLISGGNFESAHTSTICITRGAWIDEISGGTFRPGRTGYTNSYNESIRNASIWMEYDTSGGEFLNRSGIGTISGGLFTGGYFGIVLISRYPTVGGALVNEITGGTFKATIGVQNDKSSDIGKITGGTIIGGQGLFNVGRIGEIGGQVSIKGTTSYGILNYQVTDYIGVIGEISGGQIISEAAKYDGIANIGTIDLISGGLIVGGRTAISCDGSSYKGALNTITAGVFWGKNNVAIELGFGKPLTLEPGIFSPKGVGRYMGKNGLIFNDESLVTYPEHMALETLYFMSPDGQTESVPGVTETEFKYLMVNVPHYTVTVHNTHLDAEKGEQSGAGEYEEGETVTLHAGTLVLPPYIYDFVEWRVEEGDIDFDTKDPNATFVMPAENVTLSAIWDHTHEVIVEESYAASGNTGAGFYHDNDLVAIKAGVRMGYAFVRWETESPGVEFDNATSASATFIQPDNPVTVRATWVKLPDLWVVTVNDSYAAEGASGAGTYREGFGVVIDAGSREGYVFAGWTIDEGNVTLLNPAAARTKFTISNGHVTVTANWNEIVTPDVELEPVHVRLQASKTVTGNGAILADGQFSFEVYEGETLVASGRNDGTGQILFDAIELSQAGTYSYRMLEAPASADGWISDDSAFDVTVTVLEENNQLSATVEYQGGAIPNFNNIYNPKTSPASPEPIQVALSATKTVSGEGATLSAGQFSFGVFEGSALVASGVNNELGQIKFNPIEFTQTGTHYYRVIETSENGEGWITDNRRFDVIVTVTEENNQLSATVEYPDGQIPNFNNVFNGNANLSNTIQFSKILSDNNGKMVESNERFIIVQYVKDGDNWVRLDEFAVTANKGPTAITGLEAGNIYQFVEKANSWYAPVGYTVYYENSVVAGNVPGDTIAIAIRQGDEGRNLEIILENKIIGAPGGQPGGGAPSANPKIIEILERATPLSPFVQDHVAYIFGYPDQTVRPERDISRAEVATIFYRLLTNDVRSTYRTKENPFSDVSKDEWFGETVSSMSNMDIVKGYPDGRFNPNASITRAELAVIAARFARVMNPTRVSSISFSDIDGHWAKEDIMYAGAVGWVSGYPDGTFKPDQAITRAEVMTLVNRMLGRVPEIAADLLADQMIKWVDNRNQDMWYYLAVQEATNTHVPAVKDKAVPGQLYNYEYWVRMGTASAASK